MILLLVSRRNYPNIKKMTRKRKKVAWLLYSAVKKNKQSLKTKIKSLFCQANGMFWPFSGFSVRTVYQNWPKIIKIVQTSSYLSFLWLKNLSKGSVFSDQILTVRRNHWQLPLHLLKKGFVWSLFLVWKISNLHKQLKKSRLSGFCRRNLMRRVGAKKSYNFVKGILYFKPFKN